MEENMSAFLGPIHYWLFRKIQIQQEIVENIIVLGEVGSPNLKDELDKEYGVFPEGPLEENIDVGNIHGWLQRYVSQVEYKLADSITTLINKDSEILDKIKSIFFKKGREISSTIATENASEIFKIISDSLLDGMPCDHANTVIEENDEMVVWKRNTCVHASYWEEVGGNVVNYYTLREELIKGILVETNLIYEKVDEITNRIRKEG
jgi:hypothetical protein